MQCPVPLGLKWEICSCFGFEESRDYWLDEIDSAFLLASLLLYCRPPLLTQVDRSVPGPEALTHAAWG